MPGPPPEITAEAGVRQQPGDALGLGVVGVVGFGAGAAEDRDGRADRLQALSGFNEELCHNSRIRRSRAVKFWAEVLGIIRGVCLFCIFLVRSEG